MTEIPPPSAKPASLKRRLLFALLFFVGGIGAAGWIATQTDWGRSLSGQGEAVPPLTVDSRTSGPAPAADSGLTTDLEARLAQVEGQNQGELSYRIATLPSQGVLLIMAARRALEIGRPLGPLEGELQAQFGSTRPHLVAALVSSASEGVTLDQLRGELAQLAPKLGAANGDTLWSRFTSGLSSLIVVRQAGESVGRDDPSLSGAQAALASGNVSEALAIVSRLPGRGNATTWMARARRYLDARRTLDALEASVFDAPAVAPLPQQPSQMIAPPAPVMPDASPPPAGPAGPKATSGATTSF